MSKFKIGDKVKVVKSAKEFDGTDNFAGRYRDMENDLGVVFTITMMDVDGVTGNSTDWWWPEQSLELVEEPKIYSVRQVLQATDDIYDAGMLTYIEEIEKYLENRLDPEWKEYLRLKEKFEN